MIAAQNESLIAIKLVLRRKTLIVSVFTLKQPLVQAVNYWFGFLDPLLEISTQFNEKHFIVAHKNEELYYNHDHGYCFVFSCT